MLKATWVFGTQNFEAAKAVRTAVFVEEQGYSLSEEFDDFDYYAWHAVIYYEDAPIATGRVYLDQGNYTIGRVCVRKEFRGQHVGDLLIRLLLDRALNAGAEGIHLCAQVTAQGFYEKFGLKAMGKPYRKPGELYDQVDMYAPAQEVLFPRTCENCPNAGACDGE